MITIIHGRRQKPRRSFVAAKSMAAVSFGLWQTCSQSFFGDRRPEFVNSIVAPNRGAYGFDQMGNGTTRFTWHQKSALTAWVSLKKRGVALALTFPAFISPALAVDLPLNPDVTPATISTTICQTGWTQTVRPYVGDMKRIKAEMLAKIGEPIERRNQYELDHLIPLALGGAVIDRRNLALQPIDEAREKDAIEVCVSSIVCQGKLDLEDAQSAIWENWQKTGELCGSL